MTKSVLAYLFAALLLLTASAVYADEFHIASNGDMQAIGKMVGKNALNLFTLNVWGYKLKIFIESGVRVESMEGKAIKLEEILEGHIIEIKGKAFLGRSDFLEPVLVRDLSIGKKESAPPPVVAPVVVPAPVVVLAPVTPVVPAKQQEASANKGILIQNLRLGMRGGEVSILQRFLQKNNWGIPDDGPVTGYFGGVTKKALMNFQKSKGLAAVGAAGPQTRQLINSLLSK